MHRRSFLTGALAIAAAPALPPITASIAPALIDVPAYTNHFMPLPHGIVEHFAEAQRIMNDLRSEQLAAYAFMHGEQWTPLQLAQIRKETP